LDSKTILQLLQSFCATAKHDIYQNVIFATLFVIHSNLNKKRFNIKHPFTLKLFYAKPFQFYKISGGESRPAKTTILAISLMALMFEVKAQNITGSSTVGYLPKFTVTSTVDNSSVYQSGTFVGIKN